MTIRKWQKVGAAEATSPTFYGKGIVKQIFRDPDGREHNFLFLKERKSFKPRIIGGTIMTIGAVLIALAD